MISSVIFDMNGVITDDEDLHQTSTQQVFKKRGLSITPEIYRQYCLGRTDESAFVDLIADFQLQKLAVNSLIKEKSDLYQELITDNLKVYPGVVNLIERLENYTLALTTSSTFKEAQRVIHHLQLKNRFKIIVNADDVKRGKPDPEPYVLTAKKLGVLGKDCVVIEDSENGIRSAIAAKMKCIAIPNTQNRDNLKLANCIIENYSEVTDELIQNL